MSYPSVTDLKPHLENIAKDFPDELDGIKPEVLELAKSSGEIHGASVATLELTEGGDVIVTSPSAGIKFTGYAGTQLWATGTVAGMYYFDKVEFTGQSPPCRFIIGFTSGQTIFWISKEDQRDRIFRVFTGSSFGPRFVSVSGVGNFSPL
ncbi:hypothetical protein BOTBODRAFT_35773 [Botryobasidium botryosum FD-172 SS1]|uniref:Uncharacterized protein n=1 Tax=Botryobasidium botryosum (strain FD-172 SS1) TaxID=930990 RepID=A0A067M5G2_BOTB1|nr:hypothetical protein BOTBODRAFT_35773 [Botryobasidium botryosum FD-172 SS1]